MAHLHNFEKNKKHFTLFELATPTKQSVFLVTQETNFPSNLKRVLSQTTLSKLFNQNPEEICEK